MRDGLLAGMNRGDIEAQLPFLHPNVVVTWHNAEVSRGRDGVRKYLDRMLHGPAKVVESFGAEVKVEELVMAVLVVRAYSYLNTLQHNQLEQYSMHQVHSLHNHQQ